MLSIVSEHLSGTIASGDVSGGRYAAMVTDGDELCSAKAMIGKFSPPILRCDTTDFSRANCKALDIRRNAVRIIFTFRTRKSNRIAFVTRKHQGTQPCFAATSSHNPASVRLSNGSKIGSPPAVCCPFYRTLPTPAFVQ
jgi:hypothetical protein